MKRALAILLLCAQAHAEPPRPGIDDRVAYIAGLLDAVAASDQAARTNTGKYIYAVERNKCQAPVESLHVGCLLEAADRNCQHAQGALREQCNRLSDVIVTNRLSEAAFVPKDLRYEIMDKHRDYKAALERELRRRYAILVAELSMSHHFPGSGASSTALARGIEGFCRDISGTRDLSWQYCVAAVVWFIGTDGRMETP